MACHPSAPDDETIPFRVVSGPAPCPHEVGGVHRGHGIWQDLPCRAVRPLIPITWLQIFDGAGGRRGWGRPGKAPMKIALTEDTAHCLPGPQLRRVVR
jgi:hypothetical protein